MPDFYCPDHPVIQHLEQTGYPDGKEPEFPRCPVCGGEADTFYYSKKHREIIGCDSCVTERETWIP